MKTKRKFRNTISWILTLTLVVSVIMPMMTKKVSAAEVDLGKLSSKNPSIEKLLTVKSNQTYDIAFTTADNDGKVAIQVMKPQNDSDISLEYDVTVKGETEIISDGDLEADYIGTTSSRTYEKSTTYVIHIKKIKCKNEGKLVLCVFSENLGGKEADFNKWNSKFSVIVTPYKISLLKGEKKQLKAKYAGKKTSKVIWKTSNKKVATVSSSGVVKAKKPGTVMITCILKSDKTISTKCPVTIYVKAKKIKLNKKKKTIKTGDTYHLKATLKPKGAKGATIKWKTSNKKVATVDSFGNVTGVKSGKATIKAIVKYKKKTLATAKCKFTVKKGKNNPYASSVSIKVKYPIVFFGGGSTAQVLYTMNTGKYSGKMKLDFKIGSYAGSKTVTVKKKSTYQLETDLYSSGAGGTTIPGITPIWIPPTYHSSKITISIGKQEVCSESVSLPGTLVGFSFPEDFCKKL